MISDLGRCTAHTHRYSLHSDLYLICASYTSPCSSHFWKKVCVLIKHTHFPYLLQNTDCWSSSSQICSFVRLHAACLVQARDSCHDQTVWGSRTCFLWNVTIKCLRAKLLPCISFRYPGFGLLGTIVALLLFPVQGVLNRVALFGAVTTPPRISSFDSSRWQTNRWGAAELYTNSYPVMQAVHPSAVNKGAVSNAPHLSNLPSKQTTAVTDAIEPRGDTKKSNGE